LLSVRGILEVDDLTRRPVGLGDLVDLGDAVLVVTAQVLGWR